MSFLFLAMIPFVLARPERSVGTYSAITGTLVVKGHAPTLKAGNKEYALSSPDKSIEAVLRDPRLTNRELRLEGKFAGGVFQAQRLYTVRGGNLYRVIYYCDVCNITAFQPGDCECCQAPTNLVEVPPDDPRVAVK